ncbi:hypothetical protein, partial [Streptomyces lydicus]|uniref:hypothetical protein n=1 Tax=Streptomyces lydicus TaxID=47763 RepID=UPI00332A2F65
LRMVDHAEYKRRQYPPGPKISAKGFGKDRRLPKAAPARLESSEQPPPGPPLLARAASSQVT